MFPIIEFFIILLILFGGWRLYVRLMNSRWLSKLCDKPISEEVKNAETRMEQIEKLKKDLFKDAVGNRREIKELMNEQAKLDRYLFKNKN